MFSHFISLREIEQKLASRTLNEISIALCLRNLFSKVIITSGEGSKPRIKDRGSTVNKKVKREVNNFESKMPVLGDIFLDAPSFCWQNQRENKQNCSPSKTRHLLCFYLLILLPPGSTTDVQMYISI